MTINEFKEFILRKLGGSFYNVELSNDNLDDVISLAYSYFIDHHYDATDEGILVIDFNNLDPDSGIEKINNNTYRMPDEIQSIIEMYGYGSLSGLLGDIDTEGLAFMPTWLFGGWFYGCSNFTIVDYYVRQLQIQSTEDVIKRDPLFNYNTTSKILRFHANSKGSGLYVGMRCLISYKLDPKESNKILENKWLQDYAVALGGIQWAVNIGKYGDAPLMGGIRRNYEAIEQRYTTQKENLEKQLLDEYSIPPMFMVG